MTPDQARRDILDAIEAGRLPRPPACDVCHGRPDPYIVRTLEDGQEGLAWLGHKCAAGHAPVLWFRDGRPARSRSDLGD